MRTTAFRLAIDQLRRAKRQRRVLARLGTRREPEAEPESQDRAVIEALLRLPLREVLVLHHCLDLPVEAVAAQTGVSPGTVKSRCPGAATGWPRCSTPTRPHRCPSWCPSPGRNGMPGRDLPDLDQRLRSLPAALAVDAPAGLAERIAHQGRRRRWLRRATAAAAVLVLLGGVAVTRSVLVNQPAPVLNPGLLVQDATPAQLAAGRWQALPPMPASEPGRRTSPAVVWTGRQLIVWGGATSKSFRSLTDGAAYDPGTRRWTPLPPAPQGQWLGLERGTAAWTGREMLVWGGISFTDPAAGGNVVGRPSSGVAYDPARRSWRQLPALPEELRSLRSDHWTAWTGRELLVGGVREAEAGGVTVAGYDPAANRWRWLPQSPGLTGGPATSRRGRPSGPGTGCSSGASGATRPGRPTT